MEVKVDTIIDSVKDQAKIDTHFVHDCVEDAIMVKFAKDQEEMEDIKKRRMNVIVHGLKEPAEEDDEARKSRDEDEIVNMLHQLNCDDVSVTSSTRLGRKKRQYCYKTKANEACHCIRRTEGKSPPSGKKLEEEKGAGVRQGLHTSGLNTTPERETKEASPGIERTPGTRREKFAHCQGKDCYQKNVVKTGDIRLKCLYSNANSIVGKMQKLRERIDGQNIIGIAETWATDNVTNAELYIEGYTLYRHDRKDGKGGGLIM